MSSTPLTGSAAARPNILFVMTDQQRFDTIAALGHQPAVTPNLDRLVARGVALTNAYSTCPVCVPARYGLMTGYEPSRTGWFSNWQDTPNVPASCGAYLAQSLSARGYRTFGLGKFHTEPRAEPLGFEVHEYSEELWPTEKEFLEDDYVRWLRAKAPAFDHLEQVHGERTDMYYAAQCRPQPAELCGESWLAERAVEEIGRADTRPYFGFVSFVQPHPPIAPPIPYNRLFNPDDMPSPVRGDPAIDAADDYLGWMNHAVWAEDISPSQARQLRARYHASITFIDTCVGRILDAVERRPDAADTLICFFSDHGDHLGDHGAWQKEGFFEASCRVPFLVSWPARWRGARRFDGLAALTDLFALATSAAGAVECRDGQDLLAVLDGSAPPRERLCGMFGSPGTPKFKAMIREGDWKYIWLANGGRELLFNVARNPREDTNLTATEPAVLASLRGQLAGLLASRDTTRPALDGSALRAFAFAPFPRQRIRQFARGITDFGQGPVQSA
jgi:choline-sulfatase